MKLTIWKLRRALGLTWDTSRVPWWTVKGIGILIDAILEEETIFKREYLLYFPMAYLICLSFGPFVIFDLATAPLQYWLAARLKKQRETAEKMAEALCGYTFGRADFEFSVRMYMSQGVSMEAKGSLEGIEK